MADALDPYRVLGVARGATKAQIKAAHRTLAKRFHPDAATGDAHRFRDVHEAYQLLADPLRRREWDAKHAPGPVRADEQSAAPRGEQSAAPRGGQSAAPPPRRRRSTAAADPTAPPTARSYRWSASEVPWWEEGVRPENRRQPGARRPRATPDGTAPNADAPRQSGDFEVYNRSSGAAWSSAARQYFRRFDAELPRRGQFRHQGTQPLTAARARVAAEEEARAQSRQATPPRPASPPRQAAPPRPPAPPGPTASGPPRQSASPPPRQPASPPPPRPTYSYAAGVAHTAEQVNAARAAADRARRAATWPSLRERLLAALIAWVPLALLIGYGGSAAGGCDHFAANCPTWFAPLQTVLIALTLGLLVALPRIAFIAAVASLATLAASIILVATLAMGRLEPPLPAGVAAVGFIVLVAVYAATALFVAVNRSQLPWVMHR
jgi:curved DNA-binding protein CbpA